MPSLRDRAVFFPQATFDGKDKTKTHTHLQSFEDFVDRQKLDPEKDFKEIQEYFLMTLRDLARQWFTSAKFASYDEMKKKFTQEYSEYGKTACEWLNSWTELRFRADTDNIDEYIQKFQELATLLAYPEEHQVQIFKMMMPENIELRIKDMTTLEACIEEAKVCLSICQPSSLVSRMSTLTVAPSEPTTPVHQRSPSPIRRNQTNTNSQNRQSRTRQRPQILKRSTFQGVDSIQVMLDLTPYQILEIVFLILEADQSQDLFPDLDLEISISQLNVIIVIAWDTQQIIVLDDRIEIIHVNNQIKVEEIVTEILKGIQTTDRILDIEHPILHNIE